MPVYLIERLLGVTADLRPMLLSVGGAALVLILKLPWSWRVRYVLAVVLFLDPFFAWLEGRNDVLWLTPILVCVLLALHNRWTGASWALGVAAALKLFAFPFVLFMAAALWFRWRRGLLRGKAVPASLAGLWLPLILTATPFLVWNAGAFWRDTVGWLFENPPGFPIYGFGLGQALLITHVVPSTLAPFPFGLVQAALGLPLIALGLLKVSRAPSLANVLGAAVTVLAVVMLCGRFTNDNYIAGLLFLFGLAIAARRQKTLAEVAVSLQPAGRSVIRIQHPTVVPERRVRHQPEGRDHSATDPTGALDQVYAHRFPERVAGGKDAIWRPIARYLQRYVDPKGAVLDIGCDRGDFIRNIHAAEKWGTDLRDVSRFLPDGIRFQRANGLFLAGILPLNHFDAIFMSNYLEHLASSADVVEQLRVACQLLRPGGRVIVLQPNIRLVGGAYWDFIDHRVALTEKSLLEAAELAGLKTLRLVTRFLPYSTKSRLPQHPLLVRAYLRFPPAWLLFGKQTLYIGGKEELAFGGLPVAL